MCAKKNKKRVGEKIKKNGFFFHVQRMACGYLTLGYLASSLFNQRNPWFISNRSTQISMCLTLSALAEEMNKKKIFFEKMCDLILCSETLQILFSCSFLFFPPFISFILSLLNVILRVDNMFISIFVHLF